MEVCKRIPRRYLVSLVQRFELDAELSQPEEPAYVTYLIEINRPTGRMNRRRWLRPDKKRPGGSRAFFLSPAVPVRVNRGIWTDHPIRRAVVITSRAIDGPIVDGGCRCGGERPSNHPKSNSRGDSRTAPIVMTPISRGRRNRPDEERCCRGDSKSKLSHVFYTPNIYACAKFWIAARSSANRRTTN